MITATTTDPATRAELARQIEATLPAILPVGDYGRCLYYAHAAALILFAAGLRVVVQAGSLLWPAVRREDDDGEGPTHFSYVWDPTHPRSADAIIRGRLPEIHVWAGLLDTQEIVDFSTRDLRRLAAYEGQRWTEPDPPAYLWTDAASCPDRVIYEPNAAASILASRLLFRRFRPDYLRQVEP